MKRTSKNGQPSEVEIALINYPRALDVLEAKLVEFKGQLLFDLRNEFGEIDGVVDNYVMQQYKDEHGSFYSSIKTGLASAEKDLRIIRKTKKSLVKIVHRIYECYGEKNCQSFLNDDFEICNSSSRGPFNNPNMESLSAVETTVSSYLNGIIK